MDLTAVNTLLVSFNIVLVIGVVVYYLKERIEEKKFLESFVD